MLSFVTPANLFKKGSIFGIVGIKMILLPIIVFALAGLFFGSQERSTLMYMVGLPAMTTISMLAQLYGSDQEYATATVFITTLACIGTFAFNYLGFRYNLNIRRQGKRLPSSYVFSQLHIHAYVFAEVWIAKFGRSIRITKLPQPTRASLKLKGSCISS